MNIFAIGESGGPPIKLTVVLGFVIYISYKISLWTYQAYCIRTRYHDIPSLPRHKVWGNLVNAGERLKPSLKRHPDYGFEEIWRELGEPGCFMVDLAPIEDRGFLIIAEPQYIEALVNPTDEFRYSAPKSDNYYALKPVLGKESIISSNGAAWKALRRRFSPGFQPKHIHSLTGSIVSKVETFVKRLEHLAESRTTFKMAEYAQDLTTDIITQITMAHDFKAQSTSTGQGEKTTFGFLTASRRISEMVYQVGQGIGLHMIDPVRPLKSRFYETIVDYRLTSLVKASIKAVGNQDMQARSIIQLAASGLTADKALIRSCVDQIKSFLFAGQDTTATLIQWMCFEMNKASHSKNHAQILYRLRQEHDTIFGPDPTSALRKLSEYGASDSESMLAAKLPYTSAFIKETLRLHPPAATVRKIPWDSTSAFLQLPSGPVSIAGVQIYPTPHLIQRNPNVWGPDAHEFKPDRWLDENYMAKIPTGAWRPFERGPRNCIGQELAMLESKIVLVAIARRFVFEKIGLSGRALTEGGEVEPEVWSDHAVTSVPVDGMVMRLSLPDSFASLS